MSGTAEQARRLKLCSKCYCSGGSTKLKQKNGTIPPEKLCKLCGMRAIAEGKATSTLYAKSHGLCRKCYINGGPVKLGLKLRKGKKKHGA